jgi:regulator of protease activity HflC (stomatin/prohibitin superfamily)
MKISAILNKRKGVFIFIGIVALLVFTVLYFNNGSDSSVTIHPGEEGHMYRPRDGGFDEGNPMYEGTYDVATGDELIVYSLKSQKMKVELELMSSRGKLHDVEVEIDYAIKRGEAGRLHLELGSDYQTIINDNFEGAVKVVVGKYTSKEIVTTKSAVIKSEIREILADRLDRRHLKLNYVEIIKLEARL